MGYKYPKFQVDYEVDEFRKIAAKQQGWILVFVLIALGWIVYAAVRIYQVTF